MCDHFETRGPAAILALGLAGGLSSAAIALLSGAGPLLLLAAYTGGGLCALLAAALAAVSPAPARPHRRDMACHGLIPVPAPLLLSAAARRLRP